MTNILCNSNSHVPFQLFVHPTSNVVIQISKTNANDNGGKETTRIEQLLHETYKNIPTVN